MPYRLPTFNLVCNVYNRTQPPPPNPPRLQLACQLRNGRWVANGLSDPSASIIGAWVRKVLFPPRSDVRANEWGPSPDQLEIPAGSGRWYVVYSVDDVARGFHNEYRYALIVPDRTYAGPAPVPLP